jgi:hypothetical protein
VFPAIRNTRCLHLVVEHDDPKDVKAFAKTVDRFHQQAVRRIMTDKVLGVGIIGCGNISTTYLQLASAVPQHRTACGG